jgi:ATP synthase I chain
MSESGDRKVGKKVDPPQAGSSDESDVDLDDEDYSDLARTQANEGEAPKFASTARQSDMTLIMNRARQTGPRIGNLPPPQLPPFKLPTTEPPPAVAIADQSDLVPKKRYSQPSSKSGDLTTTRPGIELGRPLFAVLAIGILLAVGAWLTHSRETGIGVGIGGLVAALNLWAFTRIGKAMFSGRRRSAGWAVVAMLKLLVLFGAVFGILKKDLADPLSFLVGYLALPIGIVASQFLGLRADFGNGEGSI